MCGIAGIINLQNSRPVEPAVLESMSGSMAHRGPDGAGFWIQQDGQCGLAHRRLSILDLSDAGRQPMATEDQRVWITFNGEIYNYPNLRRDLESKGYRFRSNTDTEAILYLYREHGDRFFEFLDGDFGIGLWDSDKQQLLVVRDRAGVKPVYYSYVDGRFIFASEIKALLKYPGINKSLDNESFYHYLTFLVAPPPTTLIEGIYKLPAASSLTISRVEMQRSETQKYWLPLPNIEQEQRQNFGAYDEELEAIFSRSVKKRLMADVPVGVLFSGGVDSTLNLCAFSKLIAPEKVKTFTVGMSNAGKFHDDAGFAKTMANRIGSEHHEIYISDDDLLRTALDVGHYQDEPISDPVAVPLYFVTKLAKEHGVTVLHAGEGADELFCGYKNYRRFIRHNETLWQPLSKLPRWVSSFAASSLAVSSSPRHRKIRDVLARRGKGQQFFMSSAVAYYELEKQKMLSPELRHAMASADSFNAVAPYYEQILKDRPDASFLQVLTYIELQLRLPELLLMRADKMSMANSVEIRVPFLDRDLMDFAMRVPDAYKLRDGVSKEPVKRFAAKLVDARDVYKPKTGFGVPIQQWFKGQLGDALMDLLGSNRGTADQLFDRKAIEHHLRHGLRTGNEAFQLWVIYNFLAWQQGL